MNDDCITILSNALSKIEVFPDDIIAIGKYQMYEWFILLFISIISFLISWVLYKKFYKIDENVSVLIILAISVGVILSAITLVEISSVIFYITDQKSWAIKYILDHYKIIILNS